MRPNISIVTIYDSPADFPGFIVGRRFYGAFATSDYFVHLKIDAVREWAQHVINQFNQCEAICLPRSDCDDPQILESWL
jgi:hypothetical protein